METTAAFFFFAMPCMHGICNAKFLRHFGLLIRGVSRLLRRFRTENIVASTDSLVKFVVPVQFLIGES